MHNLITKMRIGLVVFSFLAILFSFTVVAFASGSCYFCGERGCVEQTGGTGWTHCVENGGGCYLGGSSCIVGD